MNTEENNNNMQTSVQPSLPVENVALPQVPTAPVAPTSAPVQTQNATLTVAPETTTSIVQNDNSEDQEVVVKFDEGLTSDLIVSDNVSGNGNNENSSNKNNIDKENNENVKTHKSPVVLIGLFVLAVVIIFVYFFIFMTPRRAFDMTMDNFFDSAFDFLTNLKTDEEPATLNVVIDADVKTDYKASLITEEQEIKGDKSKNMTGSLDNGKKNYSYLDRYNNMRFTLNGIIDYDKGDYGLVFGTKNIVRFSSGDLETKVGDDVTKISLYVKEGKAYLGESKLGGETFFGGNEIDDKNKMDGKALELSEYPSYLPYVKNINYSKIEDYKKIVTSIKDDVLNEIKPDNLDRSVSFKRIHGQSSLTLKSSIKLNKSESNDIYKTIINKYSNDLDMLNAISSVSGLTVAEVKEELKELNSKEIDKNNITINLYTNILATNLMSIEIIMDNLYINISSVNNEVIIKVEKYNIDENQELDVDKLPEEKELAIDLIYNTKDEKINGTIYHNNEDNGLYVEIDYAKGKETSDNKIEADLNLIFSYIDDEGIIHNDKPFAEIKGKLNITTGEKIEFFSESISVDDYLKKLEERNGDESKSTVLYDFVGKFSSLFTDFTHYYGAVSKYGTYNKHTMADYQKKGKSLYPDVIFKSLLGDKYSKDVMEAYSMLVVCIGYFDWNYDYAIFIENYPEIYEDYTENVEAGTFDITNYSYSKD